jgi:hypothetical protein
MFGVRWRVLVQIVIIHAEGAAFDCDNVRVMLACFQFTGLVAFPDLLADCDRISAHQHEHPDVQSHHLGGKLTHWHAHSLH